MLIQDDNLHGTFISDLLWTQASDIIKHNFILQGIVDYVFQNISDFNGLSYYVK